VPYNSRKFNIRINMTNKSIITTTSIYLVFKRILDFFGAVFGLVILSPLLMLVAIMIRLTIGKPVIFKQIRPGRYEKSFGICKFRTMTNNLSSDGELLSDTQRLTALGKFLRKTSLDELPELFNVVIGDMSLIGPRPLLTQYLPFYSKRERLRFLVRPGITGLAQVNGRNFIHWDQRLEFDAQYVEGMSLSLDLRILFQTLWVVIKSEGVAVDTNKVERALNEERSGKREDNSHQCSKVTINDESADCNEHPFPNKQHKEHL